MDTYDLSHKLAYAGRRSPVPFMTGPQYLNSVPGVPVLSELRLFIEPDLWSRENVIVASREICRVLGATSQFDIGMTLSGVRVYNADISAAGSVARLTKLDPNDPHVVLRFREGAGDLVFEARFPQLQFEPSEVDYWRAIYATGAVKVPAQE